MTKAISYDRHFIGYAAESSAYSAQAVTAILAPILRVSSVLDVGCAAGTWLRFWGQQGVADCHGVDGDYVDRKILEIPMANFTSADLNKPFDLGRRFDLVQSFEVAEHIDAASSETFAANLANHAERFVLFSAAPPGQGGEYHVNEQPYDFWRTLLAKRGFAVLDCVRPAILGDARISYWYRYNSFLYVRREHLGSLPDELRACEVPEGVALRDVSPFIFRVRKALVGLLPYAAQHQIAQLKSRLLPTGRI
jgi:SAM-dependent methyltransferase